MSNPYSRLFDVAINSHDDSKSTIAAILLSVLVMATIAATIAALVVLVAWQPLIGLIVIAVVVRWAYRKATR